MASGTGPGAEAAEPPPGAGFALPLAPLVMAPWRRERTGMPDSFTISSQAYKAGGSPKACTQGGMGGKGGSWGKTCSGADAREKEGASREGGGGSDATAWEAGIVTPVDAREDKFVANTRDCLAVIPVLPVGAPPAFEGRIIR